MNPRARMATAAGAVVAAMLTATAPAHAQVLRDDDRGADVWSSPNDGTPFVKDDRRVNVAVSRFEARHTDRAVVMDIAMKDARRDGGYFFSFIVLRTGAGDEYRTGVSYDRGGQGEVEHFFQDAEDGSTLPCDRLTYSLSFRKDTMGVRVPRSCLGDPERVRVGGRMTGFPNDGRVYVDPFLTNDWTPIYSHSLRKGD